MRLRSSQIVEEEVHLFRNRWTDSRCGYYQGEEHQVWKQEPLPVIDSKEPEIPRVGLKGRSWTSVQSDHLDHVPSLPEIEAVGDPLQGSQQSFSPVLEEWLT